MIDLHSHILPGIDDGARDLDASVEMARRFVDQGVECVACTPHILPGVFHNSGPQIRKAVTALQQDLAERDIALRLVTGADNHIVPDFARLCRSGHLLTLADTRYVLVEPPHHVPPARLEETFFSLLVEGFVPILTHPERLTWIEKRYSVFCTLAERGVWMQITSGSLRGAFGKRPKYWAERMLCEGLVHILASDAHDTGRRRPDLGEGWKAARNLIGDSEAERLVSSRPRAILDDKPPGEVTTPEPCVAVGTGIDHESISRSNPHRGRGFGERLRNLFHK